MENITLNTWADMKAFVNELNDEQLTQPVKIWGEGYSKDAEFVEIIQEDMINPTGDGCEPVSVYTNDPEYVDILEYESISVHKGEIRITAD
jgi:hypothetical protein